MFLKIIKVAGPKSVFEEWRAAGYRASAVPDVGF
jgi:hypothetical protein